MIGTLTPPSSAPSSSSSARTSLEDFSRGLFRYRRGIFCLLPRKTFTIKLLHFDSTQKRFLTPFSSSFSLKASQVNLDAAELQSREKYPTKTVHVRFQLQKECVFGEHFFVVGDDPIFGLWDPENAIPLNWSDGHVWTVDLDLPIGKSIEFKLILKGKTGQILWQPGPNRSLETWETSNTIVISEDWQNAELQRILEEELVPLNQEMQQSFVVNSDMPIASESVTSTCPEENAGPESNNSSTVAEKEIKVLGSVQELKDDPKVNQSGDVPNNIKMENSNECVTEGAILTHKEVPVLVPGLTPLSALEVEEASDKEHEENSSVQASTEATESRAEKLAEAIIQVEVEKQESEEETEEEEQATERVLLKEKEEEEEEELVNWVEQRHMETEVLEKDLQWGRQTLHKLLNNLGLL